MVKYFFTPRSIAVVGASHDTKKLGNVIVSNLIKYKYKGKVYPVNPKGGRLYGKKVMATLADIAGDVDMALIVIPAAGVPQAIKECGQKKIRAAIIISAGFSEQDKAGARLEKKVTLLAKQYNVRILGPNCLGLIIPGLQMNASFAVGLPKPGNVAVISQSGAMAVSITDWALSLGLGFSTLISLGNKSDVNEEELIRYLGADKQTNVIVMYLESVSSGRTLLRTIKRVSKNKPIIILHPGQSEQAQHAVASHTGAIAGAYQVQQAALRAAGAIVVETLMELFSYTRLFEEHHQFTNERVAIVTNAGGPGILATDAVVQAYNLQLTTFDERTIDKLEQVLPEAAATANPVDVVGDASAERYAKALQIVTADPNVDAVIALLTHQYVTDTKAIARAIITVQKKNSNKPIIASFIGGDGVVAGRKKLIEAGVLQFKYPEKAVRALSILGQYHNDRGRARSFPDIVSAPSGKLIPVLGKKAERIVKRYTPLIMASVEATSVQQAVRGAKKLQYPVVAKIMSSKFLHKTDAQLVAINIIDEQHLRATIRQWNEKGIRLHKSTSVLLQPYHPGMIEMIIGAKRDPELGPYLVVGIGGVFVEAIGDQAIIPAPVNASQAKDILFRGTLGRMLRSDRGAHLPIKEIISIITGVSKMMVEQNKIMECDLNPVIVGRDGAMIADIRILIKKK